jgi:hypothetical protein
MYRKILFTIILVLSISGFTKAQEQKLKRDSLRTTRDSLLIIRDSINITQDSLSFKTIEKYSQKSKFTKFIHSLIFKHVAVDTKQKLRKSKTRKSKPYLKAEGKIVRDIQIVTLDPFGYNLQDTSVHPRGFLIKTGNNLHMKTRPGIIRNLLLFKKNEPYDSLLVNESMRLIRLQKYVRDVYSVVLPTPANNDSVDVFIRLSDVWSIEPYLSISKIAMKIGLTDFNLAGLGNRFQGDIRRNITAGYNMTRLSYLIPNIRRSFINLNIQYLFPGRNDMIKNFEFVKSYYSPSTSNLNYLFTDNNDIIRSIELERTFYSPYAKWAGGIFLGQMVMAQSYIKQDSILYLASRTNIQDYWGARAWQILRGYYADGRITSFVVSGRIMKISYPGKPPGSADVNVFNSENSFFAGVGITSRKYIQEQYIFDFGKVEDIPVGKAFALIAGLDVQQTNRWYYGFKASWGNYYPFGYLSTHLEYGTFKGISGFQQGVIAGRINYFTRLLSIGNWKLRQFIRPTVIFGINRLPSDNLTFSEGMKGFEGLNYSATHMMVLTLQTQSYPPWSLLGFHFGPYLFTSVGMLGNESSGFKNSHLYTLFGLGIQIKNNYLTFNTFQVSMTFYPYVPGNGYNIFKTNAYNTNDYGFRDFEVSKPRVVDYR